MMPLNLLFSLPFFMLAASDGMSCTAVKLSQTEVDVRLVAPEIFHDDTYNSRDLKRNLEDIGTRLRNGHEDYVWLSDDLAMGVVARGGIGTKASVKMTNVNLDKNGIYKCVYVTKVEVDVFYSHTVYAPSRVFADTCRADAVMDHQRRHRNLNLQISEKYRARLERELPLIIAAMEERPVSSAYTQDQINNVHTAVHDAIDLYGQSIYEEIVSANEALDVPEEFERVSAVTGECRRILHRR